MTTVNIETADRSLPEAAIPSPGERATNAGHWLLAPQGLLLASGTLLGLKLPLGKLASGAGVPALVWAAIVSAGVALMLLPTQLTRRGLRLPGAVVLRYTAVSALISFIIPNLLLFTVIPRVGAGYTGLMFALSPVSMLAVVMLCSSVFVEKQTTGRAGRDNRPQKKMIGDTG
jgi:drug/metabolite transporter (DMT)-like permease